jgi:hypothetical protein
VDQYGGDLNWPITSGESLQFQVLNNTSLPIYVTTLDHTYGRPLAEIVGLNLAGGMEVFLLCVVCCQVEVSAWGRSLDQRSPTECGVSECDRAASIQRGPWPTEGCSAMGENKTRPQKDTPKERTSASTWFLHTAFFYCFVGKRKLHLLPRSKHTAYPL